MNTTLFSNISNLLGVSSFREFVERIFHSPVILIAVFLIVMKYFQANQAVPVNVPGSLVKEISSVSEWEDAMEEAKKNGEVVVVDFYATWCAPCRVAAPVFAHLSIAMCQHGSRCQFWKVDVDKAHKVAKLNSIRSMPTFLVFAKGEKVDEVLGWNQTRLVDSIRQHKPPSS